MATQSLAFGYTTGQTLTAQLFVIGSDTVVATASSVTEAINRKGRYVAVFTDVAAGDYLLVYFLGGSGAGSEKYTLTLTTATFEPWAELKPGDATSSEVAAVLAAVEGLEVVSGTNGNGQYQINLTAAVGATAVRNVRVSIAGTDTFVSTGTLGTGILNVDAGTYTLIVTPPAGYEAVADVEVTVGTEDEDVAIALVATTVTVAEAPYCAVTLPTIDLTGAARPSTVVTMKFVKYLTGSTRTAVVVKEDVLDTSDNEGIASFTLLRLARYEASYKVLRGETKVVTFDTPDAGSYIVVEPLT